MKVATLLWRAGSDMVGDAVKDFLSVRYFVSIIKYSTDLFHAHVTKVSTDKYYEVMIFRHDKPTCTCRGFLENKKVCKHMVIAAFSTWMFY